jgi:hypothetical protein
MKPITIYSWESSGHASWYTKAKTGNLFHENCYGSQPGRSAIDPVTLKELQVTILYLS